MFSILAVLEESVAKVLSPTALAFWTLKEGKSPNELARGWTVLPSVAEVRWNGTYPAGVDDSGDPQWQAAAQSVKDGPS